VAGAKTWSRFAVLAGALALAWPLQAAELSGTRQVILSNGQGERVSIATVAFEPAGAGRWRFKLQLDESRFGEHFLAMRPFKCLTGSRQQLCHFPYASEAIVAADDLVPLEYALMFLHTKPAAVNVDARNGVYYRLRWKDGTPGAIEGRLYDVDMDPIVVPQGDRRRPIRNEHLIAADEDSHWLPRLSIE
jgi:hypothetical protein